MSLNIKKTIKLYINGKFTRSESGKSSPLLTPSGKEIARICKASRKDFRNCVDAALSAHPKWSHLSAYNKGQILYRMAEMMEGKRSEFVDALMSSKAINSDLANKSISECIDALVYYAGFSDKYLQLASTLNPVNGAFYNFTSPEALGVVCIVDQDKGEFSSLIKAIASILVSGNSAIVLLGKDYPHLIAPLSEVLATSDLPPGSVNVLTGEMSELYKYIGGHRNIHGVCWLHEDRKRLEELKEKATDNLKHVHTPTPQLGLESILKFVNYKTIWHPSAY